MGLRGADQIELVDGGVNEPLAIGPKSTQIPVRSALMRQEACCLGGCFVPDHQTPHGTRRETQSFRSRFHARRPSIPRR